MTYKSIHAKTPTNTTMTNNKTLPIENQLPEAPASATVKFKSKNGFEYLFTLRETTGTELLNKLELLENDLLGRGATPIAQNSFSKPAPVTKPCPVHPSEMMKEHVSKKSGKPYFSHSRGTYPNLDMCFGKGYQENNQGGNY